MKKLSKETRLRFIRIAIKIKNKTAKKRTKQYKKYLCRRKSRFLTQKKTDGKIRERIIAPKVFALETDENRILLTDFLSKLRRAFVREGIHAVTIDFTHTIHFISTGTLLFYAELTRLKEITRGKVGIRYKPPLNERAHEVLRQIGIPKICGQLVLKKRRYYEDVIHWRVAHGFNVDNSICAPAIEEHEGQLAKPLIDGLFRGLGEAMTNTVHHAYIGIREDGLKYSPIQNDWWMFSQAKGGFLSVVLCDLGIGIPNTLPIKKPNLFKQILALGRDKSDAACIATAIEGGDTRTRRRERGKGLGNIVKVISGLKDGIVMIQSNRGSYYLENGLEPRSIDYKANIMATVISWKVPLQRGDYEQKRY